MDQYALQSHMRAVLATKDGIFAREIIPVPLASGITLAKDDGPRPDTTLEKLATLRTVFRRGGRVTAGNSCPLNDGAAAAVVMSRARADELGITPIARVLSTGVTALEPELMGLGPIESSRQALARAGMTIGDVDVVEINEAFAAQVIPSARGLGVDPFSDKLNPHGGAIALGHPFGMTGVRILATLLNDLRTRDQAIGLETMCIGGGQGMAMVVERLS
jgi:acetyl-CoA C-acetyltransferase